MIKHSTKLRVRYGETDQMGFLYYGHYPSYYEVGRAELMRHVGFTYRDLEADYGIMMPVLSMQIRYVRPALYDEELTLVTTLKKMPAQSMSFYTEIFNEQGELLNGGTVRLGFIKSDKSGSIECPDVLKEKLKPYFEVS